MTLNIDIEMTGFNDYAILPLFQKSQLNFIQLFIASYCELITAHLGTFHIFIEKSIFENSKLRRSCTDLYKKKYNKNVYCISKL